MVSEKVIPLIIEPIDYDTVGILQELKQCERLSDEKSLDRLKDIIQEKLEIHPSEIKSDKWTAKKKEFLLKLQMFLRENPF